MQRKPGKLRNGGHGDSANVPPGQFVTDKFPSLTYGEVPEINMSVWRLQITGLVESPVTLDWERFCDLPHAGLRADFHCVTQWSRLDNAWRGVPFGEVLKLARPLPEARYAMVRCYGGYETNLSLEALLEEDVLFAVSHDGQRLSAEHGGPVRLVVPKRYAWKSAKWVSEVEMMACDSPGFWESRGYHMNGDYWKEQRFWDYLS